LLVIAGVQSLNSIYSIHTQFLQYGDLDHYGFYRRFGSVWLGWKF